MIDELKNAHILRVFSVKTSSKRCLPSLNDDHNYHHLSTGVRNAIPKTLI
jgi:hypothetical protein